MDSGCTHPITTITVTNTLKMKVTPLERDLEIVEASGKNLRIMGTIKTYLECEVLGGRTLIESAVIEGEGASEVLVSIGLMKKWDLIHDSFLTETVSDFLQQKMNKTEIAYSSRYSFDSSVYNESRRLKEPSKECKKLKSAIITK